jgi:hypothetical protein
MCFPDVTAIVRALRVDIDEQVRDSGRRVLVHEFVHCLRYDRTERADEKLGAVQIVDDSTALLAVVGLLARHRGVDEQSDCQCNWYSNCKQPKSGVVLIFRLSPTSGSCCHSIPGCAGGRSVVWRTGVSEMGWDRRLCLRLS